MNGKTFITFSLVLGIAGCGRDADLEQRLNTISWSEVGGSWVKSQTNCRLGDLVPCPDDVGEFALEISAMRQGECHYCRRQAFRKYDGKGPDPADEAGMSVEHLVCATLVDGFASGSYHYTEFASDLVTVKIDWEVSRQASDEASQTFHAELKALLGQSGKVDVGNGNTLEWTFRPSS